MSNRQRKGVLDSILTAIVVFSVFLGFSLHAFRDYMVEGAVGESYIFGGDGMAHVYKITELASRTRLGMTVDWTDAWYLGYHPYHFYPPLSYAIYTWIANLVGDVGLGVRLGVALSFLVSLIGMHLVAIEITKPFQLGKAFRLIVSTASAVYYAYHPYTVSFVTFVGDLPAAYAFSFFPFCFYFYLRGMRYGGLANYASCSIFLFGTFLAHPYLGLFAAGAIGLHFVIQLVWARQLMRHDVTEKIAALFGVGLFFLGLTAFWIIPYYYEGEVLAQTAGYEWTIPISSVRLMNFFDPSMKTGWAPSYLGVFAVSLLALSFINEKRLSANATYLLMLIVAMYSALGINAPLSFLNPLLYLGVYPDRATMLCVFCLACGLASAGGSVFEKALSLSFFSARSHIAIALCSALILSTIVDSSSIAPVIGLSSPVLDFNDVCHFIRKQESSDGRTLFVGSDAPLYSYSPALTGRNLAGGYYLQGSRMAYAMEYCRYFALARNETMYALNKYDMFNVEYIVADRKALDLIASLLDLKVLLKVYQNAGYTVYRYLGQKGMVQSALSDIFVIGQSYPALVAKSVLERADTNVTVTIGRSPYVDDYTLDELMGHEALVLYSFTYYNKMNAESLLKKYVNAGRLLIVDMDGFFLSSMDVRHGEFLEVQFTTELIYDSPMSDTWGERFNVTYSSLTVDNSFSKGISAKGEPWYAVTYENLSKTLLEVNGRYKAIGTRDNAFFVGLNLFYHALLYNNPGEIDVLQGLCVPSENARKHTIEYEIIKDMPFEKDYSVNAMMPTDVLLSVAWSPHLRITVDDKPAIAAVQDGLIRMSLPGGNTQIRITYLETPIHLMGNGISLFTIGLFVVVAVFYQKRRETSLRDGDVKWAHTPHKGFPRKHA